MPTDLRITGHRSYDIRFPTSSQKDGSDAMNADPDYSAAYVVLETDGGLQGHGLTFTIGRGNDLCRAAIDLLMPRLIGLSLAEITADMGAFWRHVTGDSHLRWVGPDKGVMHLATGAVVNAVWDLWAKHAGKPVWQLVADMTPEEIVKLIDFRYLTNALTPDEARAILTKAKDGQAERRAKLLAEGYPSYTTSAGWLGYDDDKVRRLCREGVAAGWSHFKLKVGRDRADDIRRCRVVREEIGPDRVLMIDANQIWEEAEAIAWVRDLAPFNPWFIEEPTSPDDILAHKAIRAGVAPIKVATGEMCQNRILFKQFLQADAIDVVQIDAARVGGLNENLAIMLLAAKFGKPVCPHAGGVGLCEYVQHLSMIDYLCISGTWEGRVAEFVDHLHEHFVTPCVVRQGRYLAPTAPGFSIEMKQPSIKAHLFAG
ncbi:L-fuconate dehydratase [Elstera cyanobacteriorum]|uniref:L-fuconate dehydratase n=1 Tax=Elstera cyanobacteriorum TaxID=2022747 RepID=A0A255XUW1_9PROT|nr:L-fuconate dehydratase [Elstera cyanobacteriorum]OYQ20789.1 fuconate dehydratase [Elstera cyanobacteriorum]GFZ81820.1 L-fuconate dehydratase [Elstera cyanobacteriorum]